ncbi:Sodium/sulfate symporter [Dacryopinax primogenitus]|uniref:Sodium/sulfate symporter n=1 Tax=Dacryopinax primogenitus (strain DJM 731) TaxID=1858805 RepID=M5G3D2_DACPD|nr:Sodium/sulfate symporter [Dacryopinax primogenitus]EJU04721.1 Sodium/sulfate symporter [Dacryopinax primogenitus]
MKFETALQYNSAPEWLEKYMDYAGLKAQIYVLERAQSSVDSRNTSSERSALIPTGSSHGHSNDLFTQHLDNELSRICIFYDEQEAALFQEFGELGADVDGQSHNPRRMSLSEESEDGDEEDEDEHIGSGDRPSDSPRQQSSGRRYIISTPEMSPTEELHANGIQPGRPRALSAVSNSLDLELGVGSSRDGQGRRDPSPHVHARSRSTSTNPLGSLLRGVTSNVSDPSDPLDIWTSNSDHALDTRLIFKRRITSLYISFTSLKSYVELNFTGFTKILKKYDKVTENELKNEYIRSKVEVAHPFQAATKARVSEAINNLIGLYARCVTKGDAGLARRQLKLHQREHIVWERDTVWRQMINRERNGQAGGLLTAVDATVEGETSALFPIWTPFGNVGITPKFILLAISILVFVIMLKVPIMEEMERQNCLAILTLCTLLWATEAIPLFVTSMLVPLLVVMLRVINSSDGSGQRLDAIEATKYIFSVMFSPTIMLLIGGFTIASALSKSSIDRLLVTRLLSLAGTRPSIVILSFMGVACFASMWISNVAAPTLCFSLIRPILRNLPPHSSFAPCIIIAIALAANIGGQSSPISSPQNLIALEAMNPRIDWLGWFIVALPVSTVSIVVIWLLLLVAYHPSQDVDGNPLEIRPIRATKESLTGTQYYIIVVTIITIVLWLVEHGMETIVGDMGVIALIPVIAFFGTGVLKKADFESFLWSVVFLAMGGIALGKAVVSSGLIETFGTEIRIIVSGLDLYQVVLVLSAVVLIVSTFISHTIASVLLVPIALEVGERLAEPHPRLLIMLTALLCSTGMGMPVSGFPNQTAANQEDEVGRRYLTNVDFLKNGVPASIIAAIVVATIGYLLMRAVGL